MKSQAGVSVLIPAYNAERYLSDCLDSVLAQTFVDFEVVVIDDGSHDRTRTIADQYAARDRRVSVHSQPNRGISATRNAAVQLAAREYLVFVDSDDVVSEGHLAQLVGAVASGEVNLAICPTRQIYGDGDKRNAIYAMEPGIHPAEDVLAATMYYDIYPSPWGRIVKRSLFDRISYEAGVLYEDMLPACQLIAEAGNVAFVGGHYDYIMRPESIQHREFTRDQLDKVTQAVKVYDEFGGRSSALEAAASHLVVSCAFNTLSKIPLGPTWAAERAEIHAVVRAHRRRVVLDRRARLKARVACLITYFSFSILDRLYGSFKSV